MSLEQIFSGELEPDPTLLGATWLDDGTSLIEVKGQQVVVINARTGVEKVLASNSELKGFAPESAVKAGQKLLLYGNSQKVWRLNTLGDYAVFDLASRKLQHVGSRLMFAKLSPDGRRVGYVFHNNLYVLDLASKRTTQITGDGTTTIINGTFDWVYEEELGLRDGWRWSPDGKSIAFWQVDSRPESLFTLVDQSVKKQVLKQFPYPHPGSANARVRIGVVPTSGGPVRWMKPEATPWNGYIARMSWVPNSNKLLIQFLNRLQNQRDFHLVDARTGQARRVWRDQDSAWVDVTDTGKDGLAWVSGGGEFVALSEQSGQRHAYAVNLTGRARDLTPGDFDIDPERVRGIGDSLYFFASPNDATQSYLYRSRVHSPKPERLTPKSQSGFHNYFLAPKGNLAIHEHSRLGEPPVRELVELPSHRIVREVTSNKALRGRLALAPRGTTERRTFTAADQKTPMDGVVVYPPNFNPKRRYPVLFDIYGGPSGTTVKDQWLGVQQLFWWYLAQQGYIVASVDNRGTPAPKGRVWRKSIYLQMSPMVAADLAAAAREVASLPYVDPKRVGIWGWSSGGVNTLHSLFAYPDVWAMGIAVAPVSDINLYDTIYTERYSGLPSENPQTYREDSPIHFVQQLRSPLLIAYGTGDDNCHAQNSEWLIDKLIEHGKSFTAMPYPGRTHEISEGKGTTLHLFKSIVEFLKRHLPTDAAR